LSEDRKKLDSSEIRSHLSLTNDLFFPIDTDNEPTPDKSLENREKLVSSEILPESSFTDPSAVELQESPDKSPKNQENLSSVKFDLNHRLLIVMLQKRKSHLIIRLKIEKNLSTVKIYLNHCLLILMLQNRKSHLIIHLKIEKNLSI
jgi:hypothetical protein